MLEIFDDGHGSRSAVLTSQLPVEKWDEYVPDPPTADAPLDRVVTTPIG